MSENTDQQKSHKDPATDQSDGNGGPELNGSKKLSMATYTWAAALAAMVGFAAVYFTSGGIDPNLTQVNGAAKNSAVSSQTATNRTSGQSSAPASGAKSKALNRGDMATFVFAKTPKAIPEITFTDVWGKVTTLEAWRGKVVLLNLWATWCAPCRKEMPDLDRLQGELGSDKFEVVAISVDRKGIKASKRFLDQLNVKHLKVYNDQTTRAISKLRAPGLPTTLLIDTQGREIGRLVGPADWHSKDAIALIKAQLK